MKNKPKEFIINHERMVNLVGQIMKDIAPNFDKENSFTEKWTDFGRSYIEYYDKNPENFHYKRPFAKYHQWERLLQLNENIFFDLESILGEKLMEFTIDWFNREFGKNAESITY